MRSAGSYSMADRRARYYPGFGFKNMGGLAHEGVPPEVFSALSFDGHTPQGAVAFHEAFHRGRVTGGRRRGFAGRVTLIIRQPETDVTGLASNEEGSARMAA